MSIDSDWTEWQWWKRYMDSRILRHVLFNCDWQGNSLNLKKKDFLLSNGNCAAFLMARGGKIESYEGG